MTDLKAFSNTRQITFEDLKGLRAEGYIRDSTLDQRDGFGPNIQRHNIQRFAESYGLILGGRWYIEFVSGRQVRKRQEFRQFTEDAGLDTYDVLLVDHTSRFGRNQEECIKYKGELQRLGKIVVFVSQGIISGSDRDFLAERINETLDEHYSRNLSRYVSAGMAEKAFQGLANGVPPLGYKSEKLDNGKRETKVPDPTTMPALLMLLRLYATGEHSFRTVADILNAQGHRTREGHPFGMGAIKDVLSNRFYEGKVIYHKDLSDEQVMGGVHEVPVEVKELWLKCQEVKEQRQIGTKGHPRGAGRSFPFTRILSCYHCGNWYYGEAVKSSHSTQLRLIHERRGPGRTCGVRPRSHSVDALSRQFGERVVPYLGLNPSWKEQVLGRVCKL